MVVSLLKQPNGGFRSETAVTRRFRKRNGQKLTAIYLTEIFQRTKESVRV
jgi:hypothetical protein